MRSKDIKTQALNSLEKSKAVYEEYENSHG